MTITPALLHLISFPLTQDAQRYISNLPARHPELFTISELCLLSRAVQNSKAIMNG